MKQSVLAVTVFLALAFLFFGYSFVTKEPLSCPACEPSPSECLQPQEIPHPSSPSTPSSAPADSSYIGNPSSSPSSPFSYPERVREAMSQFPVSVGHPWNISAEFMDEIPIAFHQRAAKVLKEYQILHRKIMDTEDHTVEKKFIICPHWPVGIGNFQFHLITSLLVGIITKRALLSREDDYHRFYEFPIDIVHTEEYLLKTYGGNWQTSYKVHEGGEDGWDACGDFEENMHGHKFVSLPMWWFGGAPYQFWMSPIHGDFLNRNFGRYFYYFLSRFLFTKPNHPDVLSMYETERERIFSPTNYGGKKPFVVGIQLRWGQGRNDFYLKDERDIVKFWQCARHETVDAIYEGERPVQIFLATDTMFIRENGTNYFSQLPAPFGPLPVHTIQASVKYDGEKVSAIVDQLLLAECDRLIVTGKSTFGFFVHATKGVNPVEVQYLKDCERRTSSQAGMIYENYWPFALEHCPSERVMKCCDQDAFKALWSVTK